MDSAALPRQLAVAFTITACNPSPVEPKPVQTTKEFVRIQGQSRPGEYIGIESAVEDAYPIWIEGTQPIWRRSDAEQGVTTMAWGVSTTGNQRRRTSSLNYLCYAQATRDGQLARCRLASASCS